MVKLAILKCGTKTNNFHKCGAKTSNFQKYATKTINTRKYLFLYIILVRELIVFLPYF